MFSSDDIPVGAFLDLASRDREAAARIATEILWALTGGLPEGERDGIVQDAWLELSKGEYGCLRRARRGTPLGAFLRGMVANLHKRRLHGRKRRPLSLGDELIKIARAASDGYASVVEEGAARCDESKRLRRLAAELPPPYREIALAQMEGRTRAEILTYLRAWRPVKESQALWLVKETHRMLRRARRETSGRSASEEKTLGPSPLPPRGRDSIIMKSILSTFILAGCAATLLWVADAVFAGTGGQCPTTVAFPGGQGPGIPNCAGVCQVNGKAGVCVQASGVVGENVIPLWYWNGHMWVTVGQTAGPETTVSKCGCKVNEGTEEEPNYVIYDSDCCDAMAVEVGGTPTVGLQGECGVNGCDPGECVLAGNGFQVEPDCVE